MALRLFLLVFSACVLFRPSASAQEPPQATSRQSSFTIAGILVERGTNQPLKHAQVLLVPVDHRDRQLTYLTSDDGRFAFTGLSAGKYSLAARSRNSFQALGQNEEYATAIAVGPNLDSEHVIFAVARGAKIKGSVIDEDGEGVRNAQVFLFQKGVFSGRAQVTMRTQVMTDSAGAFHFGRLTPGTYFIGVSARPWYAQNILPQNGPSPPGTSDAEESRNRAEFDVAYPLTYYADSLDPAGASPITLSEGGVTDISITLRPVPALHLELPGTDVSPGQNLSFSVFALGPGDVPIPMNVSEIANDNHRAIVGIAPGHYALSAQRFEQGSVSPVGEKVIDLSGDSSLDLGEMPQTSISGRVQAEGAEVPQGLLVSLTNVNSGQFVMGFTAQDGSFQISDPRARAGRYEVRLANTTEFYIQSISVKGAPYANGILEISDGATVRMSMVIRKGLTNVNGTAIKDGKPFPGAMVLLLPRESSHGLYIPRDQSDSDGTFTLNYAPPGQYSLIAIDDGRDFAYRDPSVIAPYLKEAQTVELPVPDNSIVKVNVQERRR